MALNFFQDIADVYCFFSDRVHPTYEKLLCHVGHVDIYFNFIMAQYSKCPPSITGNFNKRPYSTSRSQI